MTRTAYFDVAYGPYGEGYASSGSVDLDFTGQTQDTVSGLYDFLFREYNSNQGRWPWPDPAGKGAVDKENPQTWNRYAYNGNTPLNSVDELGLLSKCSDACRYLRDMAHSAGLFSRFEFFSSTGLYDMYLNWRTNSVYFDTVDSPGASLGSVPIGDGWSFLGSATITTYTMIAPQFTVGAPSNLEMKAVKKPSIKHCLGETGKKNGASLTLDALGFIPGEGQAKALTDIGLGVAATVVSAMQKDSKGAFMSIAGMQIAAFEPFAKQAGWSIAKAVPIAGTLLNVGATGRDLYLAVEDFQECMNEE